MEFQPRQKSTSLAEAGGNVIRRTRFLPNGMPWLDFEVHIDIDANRDFRVSFAPAGGFPYFAESPVPRVVHHGDRVMMDVLEQPGTGKKIFDLVQVSQNRSGLTMLPLPTNTIPSVIPPGTPLRLSHPRLRFGGNLPSAQANSVWTGPQLSIDVPRVGRFGLSSTQLPGYRLESVAEKGNIEVAGNHRYAIVYDSDVVDLPGSWFLWVRFDAADAAPASPPVDGPPPLEVTAVPAGAGEDGSRAGIFITVRNTSNRNVLAYSARIGHTNPNTGEGMGAGGHAVFRRGVKALRTICARARQKPAQRPIHYLSIPTESRQALPSASISSSLKTARDGDRPPLGRASIS